MWDISIYSNIIAIWSIYLNILGDGAMSRYLDNDKA